MLPGNHSPTDSNLPQDHQSIELAKTQIELNKDTVEEWAPSPCSLEDEYQAFYRDLPRLLLEHPREWGSPTRAVVASLVLVTRKSNFMQNAFDEDMRKVSFLSSVSTLSQR
jgi:hypothetical protein